MPYEPIVKTPDTAVVRPNLVDYEAACRAFSWKEARVALGSSPGGGLNIADVCVDRHARGPRRGHLAIRWLGRHGDVVDLTYGELSERTAAFAEVLDELGVARGGRVFVLLGRTVDLSVAVLGALKHGSVACTLFSAFGPEPIRQRMSIGEADVLVTTEALYRRKVAAIRDALPTLRHVLLAGAGTGAPPSGTRRLDELMAAMPGERPCAPTAADDMALLHFTSGTTGTPKGAVHVHEAVVAHAVTGRVALDLHDDDVFWCTADPGWVTGTSYGIVAPLAEGVTSIVDEGEFDPDRWYGILQSQRVSVWYTAPTAVRMMMKAGEAVARAYDLPALRFIASVGEPLNPEAVYWGQRAFGLPIHDNWWQTETGGIMIANFASMDIRPGSMGRPLPGVEAAILRRDADGDVVVRDGLAVVVDEPDEEGELALRPGWPSMFRGYLHDDARYRDCFVGGWYRSGDLARRDADGYYWFVGRADDVIKSAGHLIGPFEVESALMEHGAVAEAAVIGAPDAIAGEIVKAFVVPRRGVDADDALRRELIGFGRSRLGPAVAPRTIEFVADLPKTRSGKIMRRLLRARARRRGGRHLDARSGRRVRRAGVRGMSSEPIDLPHALDLYREMLRIRRFEERCVELYSATKIRGFLHLYVGEEAVAVGTMQALSGEDAVVATYREHGHALARGVHPDGIMAEMFGKVEGCSRGRGGSMHLFDVGARFYGGNAIVGGGIPIAVGLALADRMQGRPRVTACFFGEGAVAEGEFHESMNLAALWNLPVLFCCENNLYAMGTALARSESETDLVLKAASYEIPAWSVDGMDVLEVESAARRAVDAVRGGGGPYFLEFRTYRFRAHSMYDPELYRQRSEVDQWKTRDPIELLRARLAGLDAVDAEWWETVEAEVQTEIDAAVAFAERGTLEPVGDLTRFVYHEGDS